MINIQVLTHDEIYHKFVDYNKKDPYEKIDLFCKEIKYLNFHYSHDTNIYLCV